MHKGPMSFESLANELFFSLFEYLNSAHLLHSFYGLNTRFDDLLLAYFQSSRHLDFRFISKRTFDKACRKLVPIIIGQLNSIRLSDDNETPQQIDCFLSEFPLSQQCLQLRSLSIYSFRSMETLNELLLELSYLTQLNSLEINTLLIKDEFTIKQMFTAIWSLSSLTSCAIRNLKWIIPCSINLTSVVSESIERLCLDGTLISLLQLTRILQNTPCLRYLSVGVNSQLVCDELLVMVTSMIRLELHWFHHSIDALTKVLRQMPNLTMLRIKTEYTKLNLDGHQWEKIITNHLQQLKLLQFDMKVSIPNDDSIEQGVNTILTSFQTSFWLDEHHWYVRCNWSEEDRHTYATVYTIPYAFKKFSHTLLNQSRSTLDNVNSYSFNRVHTLSYNATHSATTYPPRVSFSNVSHLKLLSDWDDRLWSVIVNPDRIVSLHVSLSKSCSEHQFRTLLDHMTCLHSLTFISSTGFKFELLNSSNRSIRQLHFKQYFSEARCIELARSPLAIQCEVLSINLHRRTSIFTLIDIMTKLRALTCKCADDKWIEPMAFSAVMKDELMEWLEACLPTEYSKGRDTDTGYVRLWIDR